MPKKPHRKGISIKKFMEMFPAEDAAREWLESEIWPDGPRRPHCGTDNVQSGISTAPGRTGAATAPTARSSASSRERS
ncbi:MAG: transposase [Albidovulum sp.]|nr:transposase [Albidovulum sp.]